MNKLHWVGVISVIAVALPVVATAQVTGSSTVDVQVQSLVSQITSLEQQLMTLVRSATPSSTPPTWSASSTPSQANGNSGLGMGNCPQFTRNLSVGSQGSDVMQLQQLLSADGFFSASTTGFFGPLTASALDQFQLNFGISTSSAGFFGPLTRAFVGVHCSEQTGAMGTTTRMMQGTSTPPIPQGHPSAKMGTTTNDRILGPEGTTTVPHPCPPNSALGAAAALFVPHVILPMMIQSPCAGVSGSQ